MKIVYYGYLSKESETIGGGEVKTKSVLKALDEYGIQDKLETVDTSKWRKKIVYIFISLILAGLRGDCIIFVSSTPSFQAILPLLSVLRKIRKFQVHFIPVGNCKTSYFIKERKKNQIGKINGIYCQTETMAKRLKQIGLNNVFVMHNFKFLDSFSEKRKNTEIPSFVYFSRVSEEKGIFECMETIQKCSLEGFPCSLDIYGKIDDDIKEKFLALVSKSNNIKYLGNASPDKASEILKNYYMMIFPTKFDGEGFPGTILDALAAGIPILSSRFEGYRDILLENEDSVLFNFADFDDMKAKLIYCISNMELIDSMREKVVSEYGRFSPEKEIKIITENLKRGR